MLYRKRILSGVFDETQKKCRYTGGINMRGRKKKTIIDRSTMKDFNTIRETAFITGLSEKYLRRLQKEDKLPGVYSGTRFLVNYAALIKSLNPPEPEKVEERSASR